MMMTNQEVYDKVRPYILSMTERSTSLRRGLYSPYSKQTVCLYNGPNGNHCAIGILLVGIEISDEDNYQDIKELCLSNKEVGDRLAGAGFSFLRNIQQIHDNPHSWGEDGLATRRNALDSLAKSWDLEVNDGTRQK